jgi:hypothetical protein
VKVTKEEKLVGSLSTEDLIRAIEREGLVIPKGASIGLFITVDGPHGGVERIHVGYGVAFEIILPHAQKQG